MEDPNGKVEIFVVEDGAREPITDLYWFEENFVHEWFDKDFEIVINGVQVYPVQQFNKIEQHAEVNKLFEDVHEWQLATFPKATRESKYKHLQKEMLELGEDLSNPKEIADCLLLLIGIACIQGYDPAVLIRQKLAINKARKWGKPDADGVVEHVRNGGE